MRKIMVRTLVGVLALCMLLTAMPAMAQAGTLPKVAFVQKTYNAVVGFEFTVKLDTTGGLVLPADMEYVVKSADKKYATVDAKSGEVMPRAKGKFTLYAISRSRKSPIIARCTVNIINNVRTWKMSKSGATPIICSPKRVGSNGSVTIGEFYVYNKSRKSGIRQVYTAGGGMALVVVDTTNNAVVASASLGNAYTFKRINKGKFGIIKATFANAPTNLNFSGGRYNLLLMTNGDMYAKGADHTISPVAN